jgi:hypothetical protein
MKKHLAVMLLLLSGLASAIGQVSASAQTASRVLPTPQQCVTTTQVFKLTPQTRIILGEIGRAHV